MQARHLREIEFIALRISSLRLFQIVNKHCQKDFINIILQSFYSIHFTLHIFYYNFFINLRLYNILFLLFTRTTYTYYNSIVRSRDSLYIYDTLISLIFYRVSLVSRRRGNFISNLIPIKEISGRNSTLNCHREFNHRRRKDYQT